MDYLFVLVLFLLNIWLIPSNIEVAAQEGPGIVIVRPAGQDVELPCSVAQPGTVQPGVTWIINYNRYTVDSLSNGILDGYSADINSSSLIVKNIVMNDNRNNTECRCSIIMSDMITEDSDPTFLYVAGVPAMVPGVAVDDSTINIDGNNVTLTLSWGEPFNNLDPIVNYTVSCSGDVTCPPNFITTDNTTRSYTITNLTTITNYTFSVVATNSIGSGEAGVVINITAMSSMGVNTILRASTLTIVATTATSSISATTTTATSSISATTTTATSKTCDSNNSATLIGAVVGVICLVILIMVISNIIIWIYCFRKRHHSRYHIGETQRCPLTDDKVTNPAYNTVNDQSKQPVKEPIGHYAEVIIPTTEVKMTPNPAYAVS